MKKPTFLYVGAARAGSSWIYEILSQHPEVYVPRVKEIFYFDRYFERGFDWYLSFFKNARKEKERGELTHDYFLREEIAYRIHEELPDVKNIFCLREGVDRTFSEYLYDQTLFQYVSAKKYRQGMTFQEFATLPEIVKLSDYYKNMKPFFKLFPRKQILVLFFDKLKNNPGEFCQELFQFLGVDTNFHPPFLNKKVNVARKVRGMFFAEIAYKGGQLLRKFGRPGILGTIKRRQWFEKLLYRPIKNEDEKPGIPLGALESLRRIYHQDDRKLAALIGQPLPENWCCPGLRKKI